MSCHPCISAKVSYGLEAERILLPILSTVVGEPIRKTGGTFDCMDFGGKESFSELKRRTSDFSYRDEKIKKEGWWMPSCKVIEGWWKLSEGKRVFFFYLWSFDKSLWVYELKEGDFCTDGSHKVPKDHYDNQLHVSIPQERWKRVDCDLSGLVFEEDVCWIE